MSDPLTDEDYRRLAEFRYALRSFLAFSEKKAVLAGITAQQHQALLAIRAAPDGIMLIGELAERLQLKPHSATEHVDRLVRAGLVRREEKGIDRQGADRRQVAIRLTPEGGELLASLSVVHREELRRIKPMLMELMARL